MRRAGRRTSAARGSKRSGRNGWSKTAGGRRGRCGGATSSSCSTTGATSSSSAPAAAGSCSGPREMYVELHCHSAFSFLDGASTPLELAASAAELGYPALALTDHDGLWGSMEFAHACRGLGIRAITGAELTVRTGPAGRHVHLTLLAESVAGYRS